MSDLLKAVILGLVQGASEFLPISSSAHLIATKRILGFGAPLAFDVSLHLATLGAVLIYFGRELARLARSADRWPIAWRVAVGTVPAALIGLAFHRYRENLDAGFHVGGRFVDAGWLVVAGWLVSATYLFLTEKREGTGDYARVGLGRAFLIGGSQGIAAILPGFSRSGISISSGLWLGLERKQAFAFSFLLAIPIMLGAGLVEGKNLVRPHKKDPAAAVVPAAAMAPAGPAATPAAGALDRPATPAADEAKRSPGNREEGEDDLSVPGGWPAILASMATAFAVGLLAIHVLYRVVVGNRFYRFGWYNLAVAIAFAIYLRLR